MQNPIRYVVYKDGKEAARGTAKECAGIIGVHRYTITRYAKKGTVGKTGMRVATEEQERRRLHSGRAPRNPCEPRFAHEDTARIYQAMKKRHEEMYDLDANRRWEL